MDILFTEQRTDPPFDLKHHKKLMFFFLFHKIYSRFFCPKKKWPFGVLRTRVVASSEKYTFYGYSVFFVPQNLYPLFGEAISGE